MSKDIISLTGKNNLFTPAYGGSVRYYAAMVASKTVAFDREECHLKAPWGAHHCRIIGANGVQTLTVPIVKVEYGVAARLRDIQISEHGDWRRIHWGALFSAYGKSPFFDYIADDLQAVYNRNDRWLVDFDMAMHRLIVDFLDLPLVECGMAEAAADDIQDLRGRLGNKRPDNLSPLIHDVCYWQVWQERYGFTADLSILDLLMNQGREAVFTLMKMNGETR